MSAVWLVQAAIEMSLAAGENSFSPHVVVSGLIATMSFVREQFKNRRNSPA